MRFIKQHKLSFLSILLCITLLSFLLAPTTYSLYRKELVSSKSKLRSLRDRQIISLDFKNMRVSGSPSSPTFRFKFKLSTVQSFDNFPISINYGNRYWRDKTIYYSGDFHKSTLNIYDQIDFYALLQTEAFYFNTYVLDGYAVSNDSADNPYYTSRWNFLDIIRTYNRLKDDIRSNVPHFASSNAGDSSSNPFDALFTLTAYASDQPPEMNKATQNADGLNGLSSDAPNPELDESLDHKDEQSLLQKDDEQSTEITRTKTAIDPTLETIKNVDSTLSEKDLEEAMDLLKDLTSEEVAYLENIYKEGL